MDFQRHAYSLQEAAALTLVRAEIYEAESAAARAGGAAGLNPVETEAHASVHLAEYNTGMEKIRIQHKQLVFKN